MAEDDYELLWTYNYYELLWIMVYDELYHYLVGGAITILKKIVNGKDDIPYMKWKIKHV
jgi:hypothetical protein